MIDEVRRLQATIRALEERCAVLEEVNAQLEAQLREALYGDDEWYAPPEIGLTGKEEQMLRALVSRERCTKAFLLEAIYAFSEDPPGIKIIDVFICKLRAKLRPHGISIATIWGVGYELAPEMRDRLLYWGSEAA